MWSACGRRETPRGTAVWTGRGRPHIGPHRLGCELSAGMRSVVHTFRQLGWVDEDGPGYVRTAVGSMISPPVHGVTTGLALRESGPQSGGKPVDDGRLVDGAALAHGARKSRRGHATHTRNATEPGWTDGRGGPGPQTLGGYAGASPRITDRAAATVRAGMSKRASGSGTGPAGPKISLVTAPRSRVQAQSPWARAAASRPVRGEHRGLRGNGARPPPRGRMRGGAPRRHGSARRPARRASATQGDEQAEDGRARPPGCARPAPRSPGTGEP